MDVNELILLELIEKGKDIDYLYRDGLRPSQIACLTEDLLNNNYIGLKEDYTLFLTEEGARFIKENRKHVKKIMEPQKQLYREPIGVSVIYLPRRL